MRTREKNSNQIPVVRKMVPQATMPTDDDFKDMAMRHQESRIKQLETELRQLRRQLAKKEVGNGR